MVFVEHVDKKSVALNKEYSSKTALIVVVSTPTCKERRVQSQATTQRPIVV
jgi:hypothetical protein